MAFNSTNENVPRDPPAIDTDYNHGSVLTALAVLLVIAVALGLYFFYAGSMTSERTVNAPPTTQISPSSPQSNPTAR
jgi:hypothetical protein